MIAIILCERYWTDLASLLMMDSKWFRGYKLWLIWFSRLWASGKISVTIAKRYLLHMIRHKRSRLSRSRLGWLEWCLFLVGPLIRSTLEHPSPLIRQRMQGGIGKVTVSTYCCKLLSLYTSCLKKGHSWNLCFMCPLLACTVDTTHLLCVPSYINPYR